MKKFVFPLISFVFFLVAIPYTLNPTLAVVDPLSVPNNKFGIHIIQATPDESSPAASLVNSTGGDWGYITVLIESRDRNESKWQEFFNDLRRRHLIPIVRLATKPLNAHWERPYEKEYEAWADFLDSLNWPVKNRYVVIYNEPNHGKEWGNFVDAKMYAKVLDQTITALKNKNRDFFVLNAGFDASTPSKPPQFEDQVTFMRQMEEEVPGIFNKLDGWVSHSYPQPNFTGSPGNIGRGSVRTYLWELKLLGQFGVTKNFPVFITETGWQHAEGINYNPNYPSADTVAEYYKNAFENAWTPQRIVAVTPFILSYLEKPFDHFSFKTSNNSTYYPQFKTIQNVPKVSGRPVQENKAQLVKGEIYSTIVSGESYDISLTFKNIGQSIWNDREQINLLPVSGEQELKLEAGFPDNTLVEPGEEFTFYLHLTAPEKWMYKVVLNLFEGDREFDSPPFEFTTEVKDPVILQVKSALKWKKYAKGEYLLRIEGAVGPDLIGVGESVQKVYISESGQSEEFEARNLLPEYTFDFTLEKPFYRSKTISQKVSSGVNILDFEALSPDIISILLHPITFFKQK